MEEAGSERRHDRDREHRAGEGEEEVGEPHQDVVHPSPENTGDEPDQPADHDPRGDHRAGGQQARPKAVEDPAEDVQADLVGPEERPCMERRGERQPRRDDRPVGGDHGRQHGDEHQDAEGDEADPVR